MVLGAGGDLAQAERPHLAAEGLLGDREAVFLEQPLGQIDQALADHAMDRGRGACLHHAQELLTLLVVELRRLAWRLAVDQPGRACGVEAQNPITQGLQPNTTNPSCLATSAAFVDLGQSQQAPDLARVLAPSRQSAQRRSIEVTSQFHRRRHGELQIVRHLESDLRPGGDPQ
jgi:hypothetical protein